MTKLDDGRGEKRRGERKDLEISHDWRSSENLGV